jgi:hypothetical protein
MCKLTSEGVVADYPFDVQSMSSKVANTLIHLTTAGDIRFANRLATELFPRELIFDERSNLFIVSLSSANPRQWISE